MTTSGTNNNPLHYYVNSHDDKGKPFYQNKSNLPELDKPILQTFLSSLTNQDQSSPRHQAQYLHYIVMLLVDQPLAFSGIKVIQLLLEQRLGS